MNANVDLSQVIVSSNISATNKNANTKTPGVKIGNAKRIILFIVFVIELISV